LLIPSAPRYPLFPYTTLFRSSQICQPVDVRNERDTAIAQDGRAGNAGHDAVVFLDAFDDNLLVTAQFVDDDAKTRTFARLDDDEDRKSTRLNSSHVKISYAVF